MPTPAPTPSAAVAGGATTAAANAAGGGNAALSSVVKPVAPVQGMILREIGDAAPKSDMSGVRQASNILSASYPAGENTQISKQGSVPYLRGGDGVAVGHGPGMGGDRLTDAKIKINMRDFAGARQILNTMITLDPGDYRTLARRAEVLNYLKNYKEAESDANKALKLDPNNALAWQQLAWALLKQGRYKEALTAIERAVLAGPDVGSNYAIRSFIKYMLGDAQGALKDMETAAALSPEYRAKLAAANKGAKLYDPDEDNDSMSGLVSSVRRLPGWIFLSVLAAMLLGGGAGVVYSRQIKSWIARRVSDEAAEPSAAATAHPGRKRAKEQPQSPLNT